MIAVGFKFHEGKGCVCHIQACSQKSFDIVPVKRRGLRKFLLKE
jgi:hypothetical protein